MILLYEFTPPTRETDSRPRVRYDIPPLLSMMNIVDYNFLKGKYLTNILQHVSSMAIRALHSIGLL